MIVSAYKCQKVPKLEAYKSFKEIHEVIVVTLVNW